MTMTSQFSEITPLSNFSEVVLFLLSTLVTGPSSMSISSLFLESWQLSFIRDWPENLEKIWKSEIPLSQFCLIFRDWGKLGIPNLARMSLVKCCCMLRKARLATFTVSKLLRENQQWEGGHYGYSPCHLANLSNSWETFVLVRGIEPWNCVLSLWYLLSAFN